MFDLMYNDDRMYVLEISRAVVSALNEDGMVTSITSPKDNLEAGPGDKRVWALITRRNVGNYPPVRQDEFASVSEAMAYFRKIVVTTPRLSLDRKSPDPAPTLDEYTAWLKQENLFDPVLNPDARRKKRDTRLKRTERSNG